MNKLSVVLQQLHGPKAAAKPGAAR
jgi:hypothetical protein